MPIAAARSTLGSVRASSTKPTIPAAPTTPEPAAAHAGPPGEHEQEADDQRQVGARHRGQVGQAGGPEVLGQLRAASPRRRRRPAPAPAPPGSRAGARRRRGSRPAAPRSRASPARAGRRASGGPRGVAVAARSSSSAGASRPVNRTALAQRHPLPVGVAEDQHRLVPTRPRRGTSTRSPNRPGTAAGRPSTVPVSVDERALAASSATGPSRTALAPRAATAPTAVATTTSIASPVDRAVVAAGRRPRATTSSAEAPAARQATPVAGRQHATRAPAQAASPSSGSRRSGTARGRPSLTASRTAPAWPASPRRCRRRRAAGRRR